MKQRRSIIPFIIGGLVILCGCVAASSILVSRTPASTAPTIAAPQPVTVVVTVNAPAVVIATTAPRGYVSRAMYGEAWPLTVEDGILMCFLRGDVATKEVVLRHGDIYYAVNGTAKGAGKWQDIAPVWADNPNLAGTKIDMQPLVNAGLTLCPSV